MSYPPLPPTARSRARTTIALAICAAAYLYAFPYHPRVNNPNEQVRFYMTAAMVEEGSYAIENVRARWGWVNDAAAPPDGHIYSVKAPGTSFLGVPAYWLYQRWAEARHTPLDRTTALWWVRLTASILPTLAFLWAFHRWLSARGGPPVARDAIFLSVAIGSLLYAYATMFVSHTLSAAVAFGAFMILERARRTRRVGVAASAFAGLLAASTTAFEYPGFVASAILSLYALACLRPWHRVIPFALGALVPTLAVLHFHDACFGSPLTPGHRYLEYAPFRELANAGFFGATELQQDALGGLLFNLGYGLFPLTPVLALAFIGFPSLLRKRRERLDALVALLIPLCTYALICLMNNWRGGWTVGARYLAVAIPFLAWGALEGARVLSKGLPRVTAAACVGALATGMIASGGPSAYYPHMPEAFTRPLPQLLRPLVRHDFAPFNAGSYLAEQLELGEYWGTRSMAPLFFLALFALCWAAWAERRVTDRLLVLIGSSFFASWMIAPLIADDPTALGVRDSLAYVVRFWDPEGHDLAARLEERLRDAPDEAGFRRLIHTYEDEGRITEAHRVETRLRRFLRESSAQTDAAVPAQPAHAPPIAPRAPLFVQPPRDAPPP